MTLPPLPDGWTVTYRADGRVEYVCEHGCGHPVARRTREKDVYKPCTDVDMIHGCCGCCWKIEKEVR